MDRDKNTEENLNPSQYDYEQKFNDLSGAEKQASNPDLENDAKDAQSINNAESSSQSGSGFYKPGGSKSKTTGAKGLLKKYGPAGGIAGLLVGGGFGLSVFFSPALLLVHVKEIFHNAANDTKAPAYIRSNKLLYKKFKESRWAFQNSSGQDLGYDDSYNNTKCNIRCKFGTINASTKRLYETRGARLGIQVELEPVKRFGITRYTIKSMTFPDGKRITNGNDFRTALKDPVKAGLFVALWKSKTAIFLTKAFPNMLLKKFGLDKVSSLAGEKKEEVIKYLRKKMGLTGDSRATQDPVEESRLKKRFPGLFTRMENVSLRLKKIQTKSATWGGLCMAYDVGRVYGWVLKSAKILAYARFAMLFLQMADKIKAQESPSPAEVSVLSEQLSSPDVTGNQTNNPTYGQSATDSTGYKLAAYGVSPGNLNEKESKISLAPSAGIWSFISGILSGLTTAVLYLGGGLKIMSIVCGMAYNPYLSPLIECVDEIIEALGTAGLTSPAGLVTCAGGIILASLAFLVVPALVTIGLQKLIESKTPELDETTIGAEAGNSIYMGTSAIMGGNSATYGMKPASSKEEIKQFALDTSEANEEILAMDRYEASKEPFDAYNQYSFLGTVLNKAGFYNFSSSNILSKFSFLSSFMQRSVKSLMPYSYAAVDEAESKANNFSKCGDASMNAIGVTGDIFCNPTYVMSSDELNSETGDVVDYMLREGHIDDEGNPISNRYKNYLEYCANRLDPLGETSASIADEGIASLGPLMLFKLNPYQDLMDNVSNLLDGKGVYTYQIGERCAQNDTEMSNFRSYTMDYQLNDTMDQLYENS